MITGYLLLFGSAFLAATVLPFYSEVLLFALLREGGNPAALVLGRYLLHFRDRKWFYFSKTQIDKAQRWFRRYGVWTLLFAWLRVGGDALTLMAGIMRVRLGIFLVLVGLGKGLRYISVVYVADWIPT